MELLSLIILICLVPFWYAIGQGCSSLLRLPSLTGYIFGGIICGPHVSAILQQQHLGNVTFIEHACLSYIAFLAGAELHLGGIKRIRRQMTWMVAGISFFSWAFVFLCALLASSKTPFLATLPRGQILAVCNLLGVLALARSPASAVSVIHEIKGSGPYCSLVMAIVIVKDVLVFLLFSLALNAAEQASMRTPASTAYYSLADTLFPLCSVVSSLILGTLGGHIYQRIQSRFGSSSTTLTSTSTTASTQLLYTYLCGFIPLIVSSSVYFISDALYAEPLLACVAAGATATFIATGSNSTSSTHTQYQADQMKLHMSPIPAAPRLQRQGSISALGAGEESTTTSFQQQQQAMTMCLVPISTVLFGLVGANLHINKLLGNAHLAAMLFAARLVGIWIGSYLGGYFGAVPAPLRQRVPFGMITQAGIAMGLTRLVVARCKACTTWGPDFEALMAAIIMGNLIIGPLSFKSAIVAAGEAAGISSSEPSVPLITPVKGYQMEEGFVTPVKSARHGDSYDGPLYSSQSQSNNGTSTTPKTFVPIIRLSPTSPSAKMAL